MIDNILVINAGSSSIKFALYTLRMNQLLMMLNGQISGLGTTTRTKVTDSDGRQISFPSPPQGLDNHNDAFQALIDWLEGRGDHITAAGHRVVHGGSEFTKPVLIDSRNFAQLTLLTSLAPHHQPHNLAAIEALKARLPDLPQIACFDTAFHSNLPVEARQSGLPPRYEKRGIRRYGFHGSSYESVVASFSTVTQTALPKRLVIAHLGNGASMAAIKDGKSIATTMGFSTLDGLPMGTRSGSIDPGILLHLMREDGAGCDELEDLLYNQCGLIGISDISSDMRELLNSSDERAAKAVSFYCYKISRELGSLASALGGIDALVFTGGIGENAVQVRKQVLHLSQWLGFTIDEKANRKSNICISTADSKTAAWVIPTNEELTIANHTRKTLGF